MWFRVADPRYVSSVRRRSIMELAWPCGALIPAYRSLTGAEGSPDQRALIAYRSTFEEPSNPPPVTKEGL